MLIPLFEGAVSPAGYTDGTMLTPEACILRAILDYVAALVKSKPLTNERWMLVFKLSDTRTIKLPFENWWHSYSIARPQDPRLLPLPRYSAITFMSLIDEFLEDTSVGQEERIYLKAMKARIMSGKKRPTLQQRALIGGLYLEVCALRSQSQQVLLEDELLKRIIRGIRHQEAPYDPEKSNNRIVQYHRIFSPHTVYSLSTSGDFRGYALFVWPKIQGAGVIAVADYVRRDNRRGYVFEADSVEALLEYFADHPRREFLPMDRVEGVRFLHSAFHHGNWAGVVKGHLDHCA